ncbi:MAG: TetR/AcrR family transcriptional regulator [Acidobacteriia bacterium]|nr:TetR/AcrR family transcriptional regulator [Terriglobia bacterium]
MGHTVRERKRTVPAKQAIRDAAALLFAEKGFAATSTREICARAEITKPVLYYYFGNKEQLYEELVLEASHEYQQELRRATWRGRTPSERLINVLSAIFTFARHEHSYWRMGFRMVLAPEKESPVVNYVEIGHATERLLAEIVREGVRRREIRGDPEFIAGAIFGKALASIISYLVIGEPPLDRSLARRTINLLINGCGVKPTDR